MTARGEWLVGELRIGTLAVDTERTKRPSSYP